MVLFLAICGSLFHNIAVDKVGRALPDVSKTEIGNLIAGTSSAAFKSLSEANKALVIPEIANAMTSIWAFFLAAAALSFVCSIPLLVGLLHFIRSQTMALTIVTENQVRWWKGYSGRHCSVRDDKTHSGLGPKVGINGKNAEDSVVL